MFKTQLNFAEKSFFVKLTTICKEKQGENVSYILRYDVTYTKFKTSLKFITSLKFCTRLFLHKIYKNIQQKQDWSFGLRSLLLKTIWEFNSSSTFFENSGQAMLHVIGNSFRTLPKLSHYLPYHRNYLMLPK